MQHTQMGEEGEKKSEKKLLYPAFNLGYNFANCAEIIFTKATTCSLSQRTEISSAGPALPTRACWGGGNCFTADAAEVLGSQPEIQACHFSRSNSFHF